MPVVSINLVVIYSAQIDAAHRFYSALGLVLNREKHGTGPEHYAAEVGATVFEIYPASSPCPPDAVRLGFRVASVDETLSKLGQMGVEIVAGPQESKWGRRAVLKDPDGHRVEISEPRTRQTP